LALSRYEQYFSLTFGSFERFILHPTSMWTCGKWQIISDDVHPLLNWDLDAQ
jgi:hypothetical protein